MFNLEPSSLINFVHCIIFDSVYSLIFFDISEKVCSMLVYGVSDVPILRASDMGMYMVK